MYHWEEKIRICKQYSIKKIEDLRLYREKLRGTFTEYPYCHYNKSNISSYSCPSPPAV